MKKYYINMRNGKAMIADLIPYATPALFAIPINYFLKTANMRTFGMIFIAIYAILYIILLPTLIRMFYNRIWYDAKTDEIILIRFREKVRRFALSDIEKIVPKRNDDDRMGALSGRGSHSQQTFAVKSREGYDYFFIANDPILEKFFADHGIPTLRYYEEEV